MTYRFKYEVLDTNETIFANCGDEFDAIWYRTHTEEPSGIIRLTNLETGYTNDLLPLKVIN